MEYKLVKGDAYDFELLINELSKQGWVHFGNITESGKEGLFYSCLMMRNNVVPPIVKAEQFLLDDVSDIHSHTALMLTLNEPFSQEDVTKLLDVSVAMHEILKNQL